MMKKQNYVIWIEMIKTDDIFKANEDVESRFDTSNYKLDR